MATDDIYEELLKDAGSLKDAEEVDYCGLDELFLTPKTAEELPDRMKVASLGDLSDFFRIATDTLVHKAKRDLWRISEDEKGQIVIERLFDPKSKKPLEV